MIAVLFPNGRRVTYPNAARAMPIARGMRLETLRGHTVAFVPYSNGAIIEYTDNIRKSKKRSK